MCGTRLRISSRRTGLLLLLLLFLSIPLYSIEIEDKDWTVVSNYVLMSESELPMLKQSLTKLQSSLQSVNLKLNQSSQELTKSQEKLSQLEISLENTSQEMTRISNQNTRLKIYTSIGITIGVVGISAIAILYFLK